MTITIRNIAAFGAVALAGGPLLCSVPANAQRGSGETITVKVGDAPVAFDTARPRMVGGRVMVPVRGVFEKMDGTVVWDPREKSVSGSRQGGDNRFQMQINNKQAMVGGDQTTLDAPPRLMGGTTYVPLRFVSEALGAQVRYDSTTRSVQITPAMQQRTQVAQASGTPPLSDAPSQTLTPGQNSGESSGTAGGTGGANSSDQSAGTTANPPGPAGAAAGAGEAGATTSIPSEPQGSPESPTAAGATTGATGATNDATSGGASGAPAAPAQTMEQAPATAMPPPATDASDTATADGSPTWLQYLPWILGALVLLGALAYLLSRGRNAGQVIAATKGGQTSGSPGSGERRNNP
jgi:hypothetical protein